MTCQHEPSEQSEPEDEGLSSLDDEVSDYSEVVDVDERVTKLQQQCE